MKFTIADAPHIRLRLENSVPLNCFDFVSSYAKPTTKVSSDLDVISQTRIAHGIKLRRIIFNVKEPLTLNCNVSSFRVAMQFTMKGKIPLQTSNHDTILLDENSYAVRMINDDMDQFQLLPGISILLSMEFSMRALKDLTEVNPVAKQFADCFEANQKVLIGQGYELDQLRQHFDYAIDFKGYGGIKDNIFQLRLSECFLRLLLDQESVASRCVAQSK